MKITVKSFVRSLRHWTVLPLILGMVVLFLGLNLSTHVAGVSRAWGWPLRIWGTGVPGEFSDHMQVPVPFFNALICLLFTAQAVAAWSLVLAMIVDFDK